MKEVLIERMLAKTIYTPESSVYQSLKRHLMRLSEQDIYILATQVAGVTVYREGCCSWCHRAPSVAGDIGEDGLCDFCRKNGRKPN